MVAEVNPDLDRATAEQEVVHIEDARLGPRFAMTGTPNGKTPVNNGPDAD
jgi:hypothetical protein